MIALALSLIACGGGGGSSSSTSGSSGTGGTSSGGAGSVGAVATLVGQFVDDPVGGLTYICSNTDGTQSATGTTDANGHFNYLAGQTCIFKVGKVTLGTLSRMPSDGIVTPQDLAGVTRSATSAPSAVAIAQFLQSLNDGTASGKIIIPAATSDALNTSSIAEVTISSSVGAISQAQLQSIVIAAGKVLVTSSAATAALNAQISQGNVSPSAGVVGPNAPVVLNSIGVASTANANPAGLTEQITATGYYSDGSSTDITKSVTWTSSDPSVLVINASGLATGLKRGSATVTAVLTPTGSSTAMMGSVSQLTLDPALVSISITNSNVLPAGLTDQLIANGFYTDGTTANLTNLVTWSSTSTSTFVVDAKGLVTGKAAGSGTVTARYLPSGSVSAISANFQETVLAPNPVNLAIAYVQSALTTIQNKATALLQAVVSFTDKTTQTVSSLVAWVVNSVSAGGSATVSAGSTSSSNSTLTANSPGMVSIIASYLGFNSNALGLTITALPPTVQNLAINLKVVGVSPSTVSGSVVATDPQGYPLSYSIQTNGSAGSATVDASSGAFNYTVAGNTTASSDSFAIQVSNGRATSTSTVSVSLNADPLLQNQWHLQNLGLSAFASVLPVAGNDVNVAGAWAAGYTGKGVKVAVVDTGLQTAHEDLAQNVDTAHSFNFLSNASDPTPGTTGHDHGTEVAGIIGAQAFNGKGGRGVAYEATLRGYNVLAIGADTLVNLGNSLGLASYSSDNDIFNQSFGSSSSSLPPISNSFDSINNNALTLRGGKGAILIQSAGNEFQAFGSSATVCGNANQYGVSCGDPATDTRRAGTLPIIVGAIDATGVRSSYSNTGSALWVVAQGGEYGFDANFVPQGGSRYNSFYSWARATLYKPALVTTGFSGCGNAVYSFIVNTLDYLGANSNATNCQYTATMNGTSASAPVVSGVVALMLQANPNLGYRDVKYILAATAKKVDASNAGVTSTSIISGNPIPVVLDQGWVKNAANYWFSNSYGFGAVDASAAVSMAKNYTSYLPTMQSSSLTKQFATGGNVPNANNTGSTLAFAMAPSFATVEHVIVVINMTSSPALTCNQIELTSPSGTKSILMHAANGFSDNGVLQTSIPGTRLMTNAFYGEPTAGTWTLRYLDVCNTVTRTTITATDNQTLNILGH